MENKMTNQRTQYQFHDSHDYLDFEFYLNLVDKDKHFDNDQLDNAYQMYIILRDVYATNEKVHDHENGFRGYFIKCQDTEMECPHCKSKFDINNKESTHQVKDNTEETYCSYECSAVATLKYLRKESDYFKIINSTKIIKIIDNT